MLNGDFSACPHKVPDPAHPGSTISVPGSIVSPSTFDPASLALAKYLPTGSTTSGCGRVSWGAPGHSNEQQYVGRGDWTINQKHSLYGRYFIDMYNLPAFFSPTNVLVTAVSGNYEKAQSLTFGENYVASPSIVNSLHVTFSRRRDDREPSATGINIATLGTTNVYQGTPNYLQVTVSNGGFAVGSGYGALGTFNITEYQEADDIDWLKGKHQMAFGVDVIRSQDNQNNNFEDNGAFLFDGRFNNTQPLLDFLKGKMYRFEQTLPQQNDIRQTVFSAYVQDTIHVTPKLVVNVGLRWEPMQYPYDYFHRGSTFSRKAFDAGTQSTVYTNAPREPCSTVTAALRLR